MSFARALVEESKTALLVANNNSSELLHSIKECSRSIKILNQLIKTPKNIGEKQHIQTCIGQLMGFRQMMKGLQIIGGTYKKSRTNRDNYPSARVKWQDSQSAFQSRIRTGFIINLTHKDPIQFLDDCKIVFIRRIKNELKKNSSLKVNAIFCGEFTIVKSGEEVEEFKYFNTKNQPIFLNTDLDEWFSGNIMQPILTNLEEFQERDSGWALSTIINLQININNFTQLLGSSYIDLPLQIKTKKACVNVQNNDNACFAWAIVSALYPVEDHVHRISKYPHYSTVLNLNGIEFPMAIKNIPKFEKLNSISINVYTLKKNNVKFKVLPSYLTNNKMDKHINLLMIQDVYYDETEEVETLGDTLPKYHYVWIKNLSRLLSSQVSKHKTAKYFCDRCLHYFNTQSQLEVHIEDCKNMNSCKIRLPKENEKYLMFKNYANKELVPFIIYSDLECILVPRDDLNQLQSHIPCSIGFYVKCSYDDSLSFYKSHRGEDCIQWFTQELMECVNNFESVFSNPLPMNSLTKDQQRRFKDAFKCHICEKPFSSSDIKVQDHSHLTGKFRGAAHQSCNLNLRENIVVPIVFHNLSGYDAHFIIKNLASDLKGRIDLLPINKENYISFTKHVDESVIKFRFIDSFRFLASSLDNLASYLDSYPILKSEFPDLSEEDFSLLTRKGVYPYDYVNSFEKFNESELPTKDKFYSKLNDVNITDEDYKHAQNIWNTLKIKNFGEYSDLYLKTDVLLLGDIFEQFRSSSIQTYALDPANYFTLPGYTWDCMLKYTNITLELLTDIDMVMFIEKGIRGGLSQCTKRYSKANNKYYLSEYDNGKPEKYLIYFDINNQYGWAMSQYLPSGGFKWLDTIEIEDLIIELVPSDSTYGYILEVDLEYPNDLHKEHSDLPFCPEHLTPPHSKEAKLLATLYNKTRYVIHYRNLQQCIQHGLKLKKIHRALKFNQSPWLKSYIDLNTKLRASARNDFEKNLFKLMNNAVFGKTIENIRKRSIIKLISKWEGRYGAEALIAKPEFQSVTIFNKDLTAVELNKTEIFFNKPIYVGMCVLDLAKTTIYNFHYDYMKTKFHSSCTILYTDTDSLIYEVICPDLYKIIQQDCYKYFDTSDYAKDNCWNIPLVNRKVLGMMKDENNGKIMTEFVGLRSKMYAIRVEGKDSTKKSKGVKKCIVKNKIAFNDYVECLKTFCEKSLDQNLIQSRGHNVSTVRQTKIVLSPHDDKRYLIKNSEETLPWGCQSIMEL